MISADYLIGAIFGIACIIIFNKTNRAKVSKKDFLVKYSQSHIFEIVKPLLPEDFGVTVNKNTQSYKHEKKTNVKVIIMDGNAFWIRENVFYMAAFNEEGIDKSSTKVVDTMDMDKVQLDKMLFIIDQLRDGEIDDSRSTGDK